MDGFTVMVAWSVTALCVGIGVYDIVRQGHYHNDEHGNESSCWRWFGVANAIFCSPLLWVLFDALLLAPESEDFGLPLGRRSFSAVMLLLLYLLVVMPLAGTAEFGREVGRRHPNGLSALRKFCVAAFAPTAVVLQAMEQFL